MHTAVFYDTLLFLLVFSHLAFLTCFGRNSPLNARSGMAGGLLWF